MSTKSSGDPFHDGERQIQSKLGVRENLARTGARAIRDHLPEQHRAFYEQIPNIYYGALDSDGAPWASMFHGAPGFITTPDEYTLDMDVQTLAGDPAVDLLVNGASIALLGLIFSTRRRNRANGHIIERDDSKIRVGVRQTFGNCPKYIQGRVAGQEDRDTRRVTVAEFDTFSQQAREIIGRCDTFFIATHFQDTENRASNGLDVSHRGGKPGFVHVFEDNKLVWPDFAGNRFFNTLGNIVMNPAAGLFVPDFSTGDVLYMTGHADIIWDDESVTGFAGAERMVRFTATRIIHARNALPGTWSAAEISPFLTETATWT